MNNYVFKRETELIFGQNQLYLLPNKIKQHGSRVLLTYGQSSIKKIGLYDKVVKLLNDNDIFFVELGGIKANPEVDTARKGVQLINEHQLDFILAVGGGSVLDNSKHMAMSQAANKDVWDLMCNQKELAEVTNLIKIGCVLTISATGSEMNSGGVITNPDTDDKLAMAHDEATPAFSFLDPTLLETLPQKQRIAGVCDTFSHLLEVYFSSHDDEGFEDRYTEALMKNVIAYSDTYLTDNLNYEANAQLMTTATFALNGISGIGRYAEDWSTHRIEHELSAITDFTHGIGLALIHPYVLETYLVNDLADKNALTKFINIGKNVFSMTGSDLEIAYETVEAIKNLFFGWINGTSIKDYGVESFDYEEAIDKLVDGGRLAGTYHVFTKEEVRTIFEKIS
ncbi:iron-containing alcohol dehydrogenase [Erysipelotrichaceae bacterium OttesenSCG-928-M19]|nr:iron-containing alcohol dehydrogenase [Erysipelotrichaceae bacterium OttesenSCG-928-M19]